MIDHIEIPMNVDVDPLMLGYFDASRWVNTTKSTTNRIVSALPIAFARMAAMSRLSVAGDSSSLGGGGDSDSVVSATVENIRWQVASGE